MVSGTHLGSNGEPKLHAFAVAFALTLTKVKPASVSIQAFLKQLQHALLQTRGSDPPSDAISVQELQSTIKQLEGELQHHTAEMDTLKQQHQALQETLQLTSDGELNTYVQSLVAFNNTEPSCVLPGRHRLDMAATLKDICRPILYHTIRVMCTSRDDATNDPSVLTMHLIQLSNTILELTKSSIANNERDRKDLTLLHAITTACNRSISILLTGWRTLARQNPGTEYCHQVECSIIHLFNHIVELLETRPQQSWSNVKAAQPATRPSTRSSTKLRERIENQKTLEEERSMLVVILRHSLQTLQPDSEADSRLLDGFISSIVVAVGRHLFKSTFGHDKRCSVEEDIRAVSIASSSHQVAGSDELVTPSLVCLLEQALAMVPTAVPRRTGIEVPDPGISWATRERLQEALVSSIFGTDARKEIFGSSTALTQSANVPTLPIHETLSADQWFQQEVWRVIGWEMLAV